MPEIDEPFTIDAPPEASWEYLTDMENFASYLPGLVDYEEIDDVRSEWTVEIDLSMFSKQLTFDVEVLEEEYPKASFVLDPRDQPADGEGSVRFESNSDDVTEIHLHVESEASGRMAPFLNKVIDKALNKVSDEFVENIKDAEIPSQTN
ncbi:CoxG family protein [Natrialbaceae archaeon GCM10025810]|uniref:CoxG family protein n=1 Tax=Halovalidus salilacus TaxID=3075124 RepID=UPI003622D7E3